MTSMRKVLFALSALVTLSGLALFHTGSATAAQDAVGTDMSMAMVEEQVVQGVQLASGGVGLEERDYMEGLSDNFTVKLIFALEEGNYLSNIPVTISGEDLDISTETAGPWLFAELPPGSYEIEASYDGQQQRRTIEVSEGEPQQTMLFAWEGGEEPAR
jgi:hypothetical protein